MPWQAFSQSRAAGRGLGVQSVHPPFTLVYACVHSGARGSVLHDLPLQAHVPRLYKQIFFIGPPDGLPVSRIS